MEMVQRAGSALLFCVRVPVCYLGKIISHLPCAKDLGEEIQKNPLTALVCLIAIVVFSIIFSDIAFSLGMLAAGYYLGLSTERWWHHDIKRICVGIDQNYSPLLLIVTLCALVYASQYLIASLCVNGIAGFIHGLGFAGQGGKIDDCRI